MYSSHQTYRCHEYQGAYGKIVIDLQKMKAFQQSAMYVSFLMYLIYIDPLILPAVKKAPALWKTHVSTLYWQNISYKHYHSY